MPPGGDGLMEVFFGSFIAIYSVWWWFYGKLMGGFIQVLWSFHRFHGGLYKSFAFFLCLGG